MCGHIIAVVGIGHDVSRRGPVWPIALALLCLCAGVGVLVGCAFGPCDMSGQPYLTKDLMNPLAGGEIRITCAYAWRTTSQK